MKNLKRILCLLLVCVLMGSLLPMTAAAEDIKITAMEFSVENLNVGEKGTALKAHVAGDQPITLNNLATLRYDDAGEPGLLVKSDLLQEGTVYWLCINPVVKSGYSLTPYILLRKESWTINGLPYGMAIDKVVQSGSQVRFRLTPMKPVPAFVLQPAGGTVENETDACHIDWSVNFVPVKYECYCGASRFMHSVGTIEGKVFWESIAPNHYNDFMIRAYYGTGANEYVDSNRFTVRVPGMYVIIPDTQGGDPVVTGWPVTNKLGKLETLPVTEYGIMIFDGWYTAPTGGTKVTTDTVFEADSTIYARWKAPVTYNVIAGNYGTYLLGSSADKLSFTIDCDFSKFTGVEWNGNLLNPSDHTAKAGKSGTTVLELKKAFLETLAPDAYAFRIRFSDGDAYPHLSVKVASTYTVTFNSNGGSAVAAQSVKEGETAKMPTDPTKEGLDFFGWYTKDGELYEFETPVTGNIELYAKFGYTVLFWLDSSDEYAIAWRNVEPGQKAEEQAEPGREGATFLGWFTADGKKFDFNTPINSNLDLYAKFEDLPPAHTHTYTDGVDGTCNGCGAHREEVETRVVVHMFRMYNPNTGEHFYTGSTEERDNLIGHGWQYEGIGFTFPANTGLPVHRLFQPSTGEHLYTMSEAEKDKLMAEGWNYEGIAFNSAYDTEAVQHRLHNPNATVGAYHFTFSLEEKENLIAAGWEYQGIGWYSCWK